MSKKMYFENGRGRVEMFLGGAGPVRVTALSGFGNPDRNYNAVTFAGRDGQKTLSSVAQARTLIISGDIKFHNRETVEYIMKVLDGEGTLYLDFDGKKRKIYCSQVSFADGERKGGFMKFVLTLKADNVYFNDTEPTETAVFKRSEMLDGDIVFPCIFTKNISEATVMNYGEADVEPIIKIYNFHDEGKDSADGIVVENLTTGQKIHIVTGMDENEVITVDIANRRVTSSVRGNIIHMISDDTYLNRFWLVPGKNVLRAEHGNVGEEISVVCSYSSNYREGIY